MKVFFLMVLMVPVLALCGERDLLRPTDVLLIDITSIDMELFKQSDVSLEVHVCKTEKGQGGVLCSEVSRLLFPRTTPLPANRDIKGDYVDFIRKTLKPSKNSSEFLAVFLYSVNLDPTSGREINKLELAKTVVKLPAVSKEFSRTSQEQENNTVSIGDYSLQEKAANGNRGLGFRVLLKRLNNF